MAAIAVLLLGLVARNALKDYVRARIAESLKGCPVCPECSKQKPCPFKEIPDPEEMDIRLMRIQQELVNTSEDLREAAVKVRDARASLPPTDEEREEEEFWREVRGMVPENLGEKVDKRSKHGN
jgi:hypothetical protein